MLIRLFLTLSFLSLSCAYAGLQWDEDSISLKALAGQSSVTAEFVFRNAGKEAVEISEVNSSCSCTSAIIGQNAVAPEEQGTIKAIFDFGDRVGFQRKKLEVITSDGKRYMLYMNVDIPRTYQVSPRRLTWDGDDRTVQVCKVINASKTPVKIASVKSSSDSFLCELKAIREGFEYQVMVRPEEGAGPARSMITIATEPIDRQKPITFKVYGVIK